MAKTIKVYVNKTPLITRVRRVDNRPVFNVVKSGPSGLSSYQIRLNEGHTGTVEDYLAYLSNQQQRTAKER